MNILFYPQEFYKALIKLEEFEDYSLSFLRERNIDIKYYQADIPMIDLLITISKLRYQLKEYALIGNKQDELWNGLVDSLDIIEDSFESLSVNVPEVAESIQNQILKIWQLYDEVYKELKDVLEFSFSWEFELDGKLETIRERRESGDYYSEDD